MRQKKQKGQICPLRGDTFFGAFTSFQALFFLRSAPRAPKEAKIAKKGIESALKFRQIHLECMNLEDLACLAAHTLALPTLSDPGAQIDILIKRKDNVDLIVESKFVSSKLEISKAMHEEFARKIEVYRSESKTKNTIIFVLITSFGLLLNQYSSIAQKTLELDDLFVKVRN